MNDNRFRLMHLSHGRWIPGKKILLPWLARGWTIDLRTGKQVLNALTSQREKANSDLTTRFWLEVINQGDQHHLFFKSGNGIEAYRNGFEFEWSDEDVASATAPENFSDEFSGWEPVPAIDRKSLRTFACDKSGPFIYEWGPYFAVSRRGPNGGFANPTEMKFAFTEDLTFVNFIFDPSNSTAYDIGVNESWNSAELHGIEAGTLETSHLVFHGSKTEYIARHRRTRSGLILSWLMHQVFVIGALFCLGDMQGDAEYEFGLRRATLAGYAKRLAAFSINFLLFMAILVFLHNCVIASSSFRYSENDRTFARQILIFEERLRSNRLEEAIRAIPEVKDAAGKVVEKAILEVS
jgi:hypothetical protein